MVAASTGASGSCSSKTRTPWYPSYFATFEAVMACAHLMRPNVSAGVPVSGWSNGSFAAAAIVVRASSPPFTSIGRIARRSLNSDPSKVTRLVTRTIRCERTASTEPKSFAIHACISAGASRCPIVVDTVKMRSAAARASAGRLAIASSRSTMVVIADAQRRAQRRSRVQSFCLLVEVDIARRRSLPRVVLAHDAVDELAPRGAVCPVAHQRPIDRVAERVGCVARERESVAVARVRIHVAHRLGEAADGVDDRDRAVAERDELAEAARLEARGHEKEIAAGVDALRK